MFAKSMAARRIWFYDFIRLQQYLHVIFIIFDTPPFYFAFFVPSFWLYKTEPSAQTRLSIQNIGFLPYLLPQIPLSWAASQVHSCILFLFSDRGLTFFCKKSIVSWSDKFGPVAQLGERSVRIREVKGSNPSRSTTLGRRLWISHSGAKLWDTPVNNRGVPLFCVHYWSFWTLLRDRAALFLWVGENGRFHWWVYRTTSDTDVSFCTTFK